MNGNSYNCMNGGQRSFIRAIRGPIVLITVGVLFALNNFTPWGFEQTWPVILIVFGLLSLLRRGIEPPQPMPQAGPQPGAPWTPPPYDYQQQTPGGYRDSRYQQPAPENAGPAGTAKGGFGTSAPPRTPAADAGGTPSGGTA